MQDCWSQYWTVHSYILGWYQTDRHLRIPRRPIDISNKIKSVKAQLAILDETAIREVGTSKKSKMTQEAVAANDQVAPMLQTKIEAELNSAQEAAAEAKNRAELAANDIFQLYANWLCINKKYTWNKIVHEQTASDSYTDLQGCTKKDPGDSRANHLTIV